MSTSPSTPCHETKRIKLSCQCGACNLPFAYVQNGALVVVSRHNGESHPNVLPIEEVERLLREARHNP